MTTSNLQRSLKELVPSFSDLIDVQSVGGGCISDAKCVRYRDAEGRSRVVFAKSNSESFLSNFQAEWEGLLQLGRPEVISVPTPIAVGIAGGSSWLITAWIDQGRRGGDYFRRFGEQLAQLHRATLGQKIGLDHQNFLGSARQINTPCDRWVDFFAEHRIGFQIGWAVDQGLADEGLRRDCQQIVDTMDDLLAGRDEETSLLHGDLWSGNYLSDSDGNPVIIDPAIYHGCREAEFGMIRLFGSCPSEFYEAYHDTFPLPDGWQRRIGVYVLYHLLNHLNLFGSGYHGQCRSLATEILRQ